MSLFPVHFASVRSDRFSVSLILKLISNFSLFFYFICSNIVSTLHSRSKNVDPWLYTKNRNYKSSKGFLVVFVSVFYDHNAENK